VSDMTTVFAIPFPTGLDRLCDGATFIQSMAARVDTVLATFDVDLALLGNIPAAKVYLPTTIENINVNVDPLVHWTAIEYDTAHLADLVLDDTSIRYNINGYWLLGGSNGAISAPTTANAMYQADIFSTVPLQVSVSQTARDDGSSVWVGTAAGLNVFVNAGLVGLEGEVSTEMRTSSGAAVMFIVSRGMYIRWIREI